MSHKFWYFAKRWTAITFITALFALAGTMQKPPLLGAVLIGAIGFIFSYSFIIMMNMHDPRDRQNCEDWDV